MDHTKCSLVISTYNWPAALELCLLSVTQQAFLPAEVIIADDGSSYATKQLIAGYKKKFPVPLHHVWHADEGFRKTIILNKAILKSSGDYIIQIDGDVILEKHFVVDHLSSAETGAFIRGTRAMLTKEKTEKLLKLKSIAVSAFSDGVMHRNNALRLPMLKFIGARKAMSSSSVRGSNLSFWKSDYVLVNGYNNELAGWGHEDEELAARFINAGIIKKIVKLCAVQFHLYHPVTNKENEPLQREAVEKVKSGKIVYCSNGYHELSI